MLTYLAKETDESGFWKHWEVCVGTVHAGPRYTRAYIEWQNGIAESHAPLIADKSFIALQDGKPVAAVLLPIENVDGRADISLSRGFCQAPLFIDRRVVKEVFQEIDRIAKEHQVGRILFSIDPFTNEPYNYLQQFGYFDATILAYLIETGEGNLLQRCRHGHKYDVNRMKHREGIEAFICDGGDAAASVHEEYRLLHRKCAGRETRPKQTFDDQFAMLQKGEAFIAGVADHGKNVALSYFHLCDGYAVYASGADDPDVTGLPLYHAMVFHAMEYLQAKGVQWVDTGQPASPSRQWAYLPDEKQLNIARFKRGFGGTFRPQYRGIKYLQPSAFHEDSNAFAAGYLSPYV